MKNHKEEQEKFQNFRFMLTKISGNDSTEETQPNTSSEYSSDEANKKMKTKYLSLVSLTNLGGAATFVDFNDETHLEKQMRGSHGINSKTETSKERYSK